MNKSTSGPTRVEQRLAELRQQWGKPVSRARNPDDIAMFHRWSGATGKNSVEDSTWDDLPMNEVFAAIDRATSMPGRQVLYHQLRSYVLDPAVLAERKRQQEIFRNDPVIREHIQT